MTAPKSTKAKVKTVKKVVVKKTSPEKNLSKKVVSPVVTESKEKTSNKNTPIVPALALLLGTFLCMPIAYYLTKQVWVIFAVPAITSLIVAFLYENYVGVPMSFDFRRDMTMLILVITLIIVLTITVSTPTLGLSGKPDKAFEIFTVFYRTLLVVTGAMASIYLPLGVTVPTEDR